MEYAMLLHEPRMVIAEASQTCIYKYFLKTHSGRIYMYGFFCYLKTVIRQRGRWS